MKKYSLKKTLFNMFVNSVFLPFVLISIIVFSLYYTHILNNYKTSNQIVLQSVSNHLESFLEDSERFFLQYLFDQNIADFYHYVNTHEVSVGSNDIVEYGGYSREYSKAVSSYRVINNDIYSGIGFIPERCNTDTCFYILSNDIKKSNFGYSTLDVYVNENMADQSWYQRLKELDLRETAFMYGSPMEGMEGYTLIDGTITMFKRCNYLETAKTQGYMFLEISEKMFVDLFKDFEIPNGSGLIIYMPEKTIAYATDEEFGDVCDDHELWSKDYGEYVSIHGNGYYVFNDEDEDYDFTFSYLLPQKVIFDQVFSTTMIIMTIWCCFIAAAFFLYTQLSKRVSDSGGRIIQYIDHYRMGNETENKQILTDMSIDEFDDISKALMEMTDRISDLVQHEYIAKINQQMAEYKAIQAEINPHFFYNVMNVFHALNRTEDRKKLDKGIIHLSRMFRYTCEHGYESSIAQECGFIESYLTLEKLRFEERINYNIYIEEGLHDFPIPKLLFQPIIENAMNHGMPEDGASMEIRVNICTTESKEGQKFVWITIANDGIPYTENVHTKPGVGIVSVKERLYITYPDSLFWYSREDRFQTICNMMIPVVVSGEKE